MSLKPTKLIVCADGEDVRTKRQELVNKYEKTSQFVKWSDTAVELKNKLYIFKVVNVPPTVLDLIRGYDEVEPNHLKLQLESFIKEISEICNISIIASEAKKGPSEPVSTPDEVTDGKEENSSEANE